MVGSVAVQIVHNLFTTAGEEPNDLSVDNLHDL